MGGFSGIVKLNTHPLRWWSEGNTSTLRRRAPRPFPPGHQISLRAVGPHAAERAAGTATGREREDRARVPAPRHRDRRLQPERPRYWAAQLLEPYVDEEVSWAIRYHQVLRFFPDESVGDQYPEMYVRLFGQGYTPEPYVQEAYRDARDHKWYMTARLITVNDLYSFDPNTSVSLEEFTDVVGRNFRQPAQGLGFDGSPAAHMWRTIMWPTRDL